MQPLLWAGVAAAGFAAGVINSIAGGGSFVSFPTLLLAGVPPIVANATNNVAAWASTIGSVRGFREELRGLYRRLIPAIVVSMIGGLVGACILLSTPEVVFSRLVPWLLLGATVIFALSDRLRRMSGDADHARIFSPKLSAPLFAVAIYGGYFGAGSGILILALLALSGFRDLMRASGIRSLLMFVVNGVACVPFIVAGKVDWSIAVVVGMSALGGAYVSARITRRVDPKIIRPVIIAIGLGMSLFFFVHA